MGNLIGKLPKLIMYICVATIISQAIGLFMLMSSDRLNSHSLNQISAVIHGVELVPASTVEENAKKEGIEQASLVELEEEELIQQRQIELREQALSEGLVALRNIRRSLENEQIQFSKIKDAFIYQVNRKLNEAETEGILGTQRMIELMKPKQAKGILLKMIENEKLETVVQVFKTMDDAKQKKLLATFTSEEEDEQYLYDILDKIQSQKTVVDAIKKTQKALENN